MIIVSHQSTLYQLTDQAKLSYYTMLLALSKEKLVCGRNKMFEQFLIFIVSTAALHYIMDYS